jgi:hypothetical protein
MNRIVPVSTRSNSLNLVPENSLDGEMRCAPLRRIALGTADMLAADIRFPAL